MSFKVGASALACVTLWCGSALGQPASAPDFPAAAQPGRYALVISESAYSNLPLPGARQDAVAMEKTLKDVGFDVTTVVDKTRAEIIDQGLRPFLNKIREGDVVVIYYSGHGFNYAGEHYLVPLGAPVGVDTVNELPQSFIAVSALHAALSQKLPAWALLALDACRTVTQMVSVGDAAQQSKIRATHQAVSFPSANAVIAYATGPGHAAITASGSDLGVYTRELTSHLAHSQEEVDDVLKRVRSAVITRTHGDQTPWIDASSSADVFLRPGPGIEDMQRNVLLIAVQDGLRSGVMAFIDRFGTGPYGAAARRWLADHPHAPLYADESAVDPATVEAAWASPERATASRVTIGLTPASAPATTRIARRFNLPNDAALLPDQLKPRAAPTAGQAPLSPQAAPAAPTPEVVRGAAVGRAGSVAGREIVLRDRQRIVVQGIERDAAGRSWTRARIPGMGEVFLPQSARRTDEVALGRPLREVALADNAIGSLDVGPLTGAVAELGAAGKTVRWASISVPPASPDDPKAAAALTLRLSQLRVALKSAGTPPERISVLYDAAGVTTPARVRLFGE